MDAHLLWLLPVGVVAGVVNTVAGGGSFLTLSAMVWLGLPAPVANATNRVGVLTQSVASAEVFRRAGVARTEELWPQLALVGAGAALGATASAAIDPERFDRILGVAMVVMLALTLARPRVWLDPGPARASRWPVLFLAGMYGGFLQAGVGVILLAALVLLGGLEPVRANARKVLLVAGLTAPALAIFIWAGLVDWIAGGLLAVGSLAGGLVGSRLTLGAGARLVWGALVVVVLATAVRLWIGA